MVHRSTPGRRSRYHTDPVYRQDMLDRARAWRAENKPYLKDYLWQKKLERYGITQAEFNALLKKQRGRCAVCKEKAAIRVSGKLSKGLRVMNVDHSHKTGKVRGLLCHVCNNHLGVFEKYQEQFSKYLGAASVVVPTPASINGYNTLLQAFVTGMLHKLDLNSHKATPVKKDVHQIVALLLGEVGEFLEQVSLDRTDENTFMELYDTANFAFLAYVALKQQEKVAS